MYTVLDAEMIAHVTYVIDGQPYVTPTAYWRDGDRLFWHGSSASRMLRTVKTGIPACFSVAMLDGLVMARSGFHSSINYRIGERLQAPRTRSRIRTRTRRAHRVQRAPDPGTVG